MIFTNYLDYPDSWVSVIKESYSKDPPDQGIISATTLDMPPRIRLLQIRHWDEIEIPVEKEGHTLFGEAMHYVISKGQLKEDYVIEKPIMGVWDNKIFTGRPDLYNRKTCCIEDYKTASVWTWIFNKGKWENQLNVYAWLMNVWGRKPVLSLLVMVYFKDWYERELKKHSDYPERNPYVWYPPLWTEVKQYDYIAERITGHILAESRSDDALPLCTESERFAEKDIYAVYKITDGKTSERALNAQCTTEQQAQDVIAGYKKKKPGNKYTVTFRKGYDRRCYEYCNVNKFCSYFRNLQKMG